jgi:DME family drug/metabolite transporter
MIGGLTLLGLALGRRQFQDQLPWPQLTVLLGVGTNAAYQICFFAGVARTGIATGTLVAIGSAPILAGLLGIAVLRERP